MSKTIWHTMMSLDGYIAGPGDTMDWAFKHGGSSVIADAARDATGAILAGRRWYDVATARHDGVARIYGGRWSGDVIVLTHRPEELADDPTVRATAGPLNAALADARAAAGGRAVGIFGAGIARQCLSAGAVDEIAVHIVPVLLGDGVRLYGDGAATVELERIELEPGEQVVDVRYAVRRA